MLFPGCGCCACVDCESCADGCTWFDREFAALAENYEIIGLNGNTPAIYVISEKGCKTLVCADVEWPSPKDDASVRRSFARPSGNGWKISVAADCLSVITTTGEVWTSNVGVVIGNLYFFHRGRFIAYGIGGELLYNYLGGPIAGCTPPPPTTPLGEYLNRRLKLEIEDAGGGLYDIHFYDRGVLVKTCASVEIEVPDPVPIGLRCIDAGAWRNLCITLTNGT